MPSGFIGLWPEVPLLAHSCVPNTAMAVVGDRLLVHAVRPEGRAQGGGGARRVERTGLRSVLLLGGTVCTHF